MANKVYTYFQSFVVSLLAIYNTKEEFRKVCVGKGHSICKKRQIEFNVTKVYLQVLKAQLEQI